MDILSKRSLKVRPNSKISIEIDPPSENVVQLSEILQLKEQKNEQLSDFGQFLKEKLNHEMNRPKSSSSISSQFKQRSTLKKLSKDIDEKQLIYDRVHSDLLNTSLKKGSKSVQMQINDLMNQKFGDKEFIGSTMIHASPRPQSSQSQPFHLGLRDSPKIEQQRLQQIDRMISPSYLSPDQEKQLAHYRKQFSTSHHYNNWVQEKKIRLDNQIEAYVNNIQKLDSAKKTLEDQLANDKHFLSIDKRRHISRIMSANPDSTKSMGKSNSSKRIFFAGGHTHTPILIGGTSTPSISAGKSRLQSAISSHRLSSTKNPQSATQTIKHENNNTAAAAATTAANKYFNKQNLMDSILEQSKRKSSATLSSTHGGQQQHGTRLSTKKSQNSKSPNSSFHSETKTGIEVLQEQNEITLFTNFTYESPFPKWLVRTRKYEDLKSSEQYDMNKKIVAICKKESFNRTSFEKHIVALFLSKMSLFKMMPFHMLEIIATQLSYEFYDQGQYICRQGDKGDCMYVIFTGQVEIIINGFLIKKVFCGGEFVGRTALETDKPRNADMRAKVACHLLLLSRIDYQQCLNRALVSEKANIQSFIEAHPFFKHFRMDKVERLCQEIKARFLAPKECLFKVSDLIDNFYIVKKGHLIKTIEVDLEQTNKWPNKEGAEGKIYWEAYTQRKKVTYTINFTEGDIVGYYDLIKPNEEEKRTETIDSIQDTFILFINKNVFNISNEIFDEDDMILFQEYHRKKYPSNHESLVKKVKDEESQMRATIQAYEDGVRLKLNSCEQATLDKNSEKIDEQIRKNRGKKRDEFKKKLPFEYKQPILKKMLSPSNNQ